MSEGTPGVTVYGDNKEGQFEISVGPTVVHQGRYRLYSKPDGGIHLVYQRDDKEDADHIDLPGAMVKLLNLAGEGKLSPTELMREMMKFRGNGG